MPHRRLTTERKTLRAMLKEAGWTHDEGIKHEKYRHPKHPELGMVVLPRGAHHNTVGFAHAKVIVDKLRCCKEK